MRFEFATATEIAFGAGAGRGVGDRARQYGRSALVVTGREARRAAPVLDGLGAAGVRVCTFAVAGEPSIEDARAALDAARADAADLVVAVGGGSAIDLGKAVSALLTNGGDPLDYLEVIGRGGPLVARAAPFIAVPTTAGTGAEVTRNAVLASPAHGVKVSLRGVLMLPRLAVVDPELTRDLPPALTASTGMDALTQLIEPYVSVRANPLVDGFCGEGLRRVSRSLRRAHGCGADDEARADMALASLLGGLALANAGLGAVHGFAAPVGGRFHAPHGAVCAALLPGAVRVNLRALRARDPASPAVGRFTEVARLLTGDPAAPAEASIAWLEALRDDLGIPPLREYGVTAQDADVLVDAARRASSMRGNPIVLDDDELREVLGRAIDGSSPAAG